MLQSVHDLKSPRESRAFWVTRCLYSHSLDIPTSRHFCSRQYWQRLRVTLLMIQFFSRWQVYTMFFWMLLRKKPCVTGRRRCEATGREDWVLEEEEGRVAHEERGYLQSKYNCTVCPCESASHMLCILITAFIMDFTCLSKIFLPLVSQFIRLPTEHTSMTRSNVKMMIQNKKGIKFFPPTFPFSIKLDQKQIRECI